MLDATNGAVKALAGIAFSSPQPPGSVFKIITTTAALEAGAVSLDDEFEVVTEAVVEGRAISNAGDAPCGGSFTQSFADSCNSVFAPLGAEVGGEKLLATAEDFGFNSPPAALRRRGDRGRRPAADRRSPTRSAPSSTSR